MVGLLTLLIALLCLYLLSRVFIQRLYTILFRITRSHKRAAYLLALVFLPGTFIHEMSHFLSALFLLVPVGELKLIPEVTDSGVRMGSVQIGKTDLFRSSIIGVAPFLVGTGILLGMTSYAFSSGLINNPYFIVFMLYLIFQITHTMFSSKTDLKSVTELAILLLIIVIALAVFDISEPFIYLAEVLESNRVFIERLSMYVFVPIVLEIILIILFNKTAK